MVLNSLKRGGRRGHLRGGHTARVDPALEPDVLVKGADYTVDSAVVGAGPGARRGGRVVLADLVL
jgi:bifunctional ADP-heptose synthase (sugar kinase/adenylyltransferase)